MIDYIDKIAYRFYDLNPAILIIYNFSNGATYYYDDLSAEILYALLLKDKNKVEEILEVNEIDKDTYIEFVKETEYLLNSSNETMCLEKMDNSSTIIDNSEVLNQIYNEMYRQNILYRFHIDITGKCNFRCVHCYHTFDSYDTDKMSLDDFEILFEKLYRMGVFIITISGGEPFLRRDLVDILKLGKKYGFVFQILTNGYLITEETMRELIDNNVSKLSFSYYGSDESHKTITGNSNSRKQLMKTVELCIKYHMPYELKFILLQSNINDFDEYVELCKKLGIRTLFEPSLIPKLDGDNSNFKEKLDYDTYKEFMKNHLEYFYDGNDLTQYSDKCINCSAGRYGLYCDYAGNVYPCVTYREYLGEIEDVEDIWNTSETLKNIRDRTYSQFLTFNQFSFCKYCYQICPGLSLCENGNSLECYNSGCMVAQIIESVTNEEII